MRWHGSYKIVHVMQAFLLGFAYMMFSLWRMIEILQTDLGGNTTAAELMLFIKTRQVLLTGCKMKKKKTTFLKQKNVQIFS